VPIKRYRFSIARSSRTDGRADLVKRPKVWAQRPYTSLTSLKVPGVRVPEIIDVESESVETPQTGSGRDRTHFLSLPEVAFDDIQVPVKSLVAS